tara:strand:- start:19691 stop:20689 length:999 start_codon:yes stop_codon:yes gene_type:complete
MKGSELKTFLINSYQAKTPVMVWGQPGIGKSQIMLQVAKALDIPILDQRLAQMDPVDLRGIPYTKEIKGKVYTDWAMPGFLPRVDRDGENGILFLDELPSAPQANQAAAYQLILDRKLGDYELPEGWVVFGAGNLASHRAISVRMSSALANRFGHFEELEVDKDEWNAWAINAKIDQDILSFINFRPGLLNDFNPDVHAFPTPRSWEMLNRHMPHLDNSNRFTTVKGFVGEGAASEFIAYYKHKRDLPDFSDILQNPTTAKIPEECSALYALAGMLASKADVNNFAILLKYMERIPAEYQVITIQDGLKHNPDLGETQEFIDWSVKNNSVIL